MMVRKVEVTAYSPLWKEEFILEKIRLEEVFHADGVLIHHIGSTAVEGLAAKPIIDFLIELPEIKAADERIENMESLGYVGKGENGIPDRRYFFYENEKGERLFHVHIFPAGHREVERHLIFRDYLRTFKEEAESYGDLKSELARKYPHDIEAYIEGKNDFVQQMEQRAMEWGGKTAG